MTLRRLLAQLGTTLLVMAACHVALLGVSLWLYPPPRQVDALDRGRLYRGAFDAAVFGALEADFGDDSQVVIVGSSNALLGFRPAEIAPLLPGTRVHNLSTASMRMDEIRKMVELVWSVLPPAQRTNTTFVVTLVFASFPPPGSLYLRRQEGVAREIRRSGAFDDTGDGVAPRLSRAAIDAVVLLRRPIALLNPPDVLVQSARPAGRCCPACRLTRPESGVDGAALDKHLHSATTRGRRRDVLHLWGCDPSAPAGAVRDRRACSPML